MPVFEEVDLCNADPTHLFTGITQGIKEGFIDIQHQLIRRAAYQYRHRRQAKGLGETFFALAQGDFSLVPEFHVDKGKQHAGFVVELQRLTGHDDLLATTVGQAQLGLHLGNGRPFA
ncbi:hypothetical protein D3C76_659550 [compost metagenome]